jgi:hypothetical protein
VTDVAAPAELAGRPEALPRGRIRLIFAALMLVLLLASLDQTMSRRRSPRSSATSAASSTCPGW